MLDVIVWFFVILFILSAFTRGSGSRYSRKDNDDLPDLHNDDLSKETNYSKKNYDDLRRCIANSQDIKKPHSALASWAERARAKSDISTIEEWNKITTPSKADIEAVKAKMKASQEASDKNKSIAILKKYNVNKLYHVTPIDNWQSIKQMKGLFSWEYLKNNNIVVDYISNDLSRNLDIRANTQNFVKLSFKKITPMTFGRVRNGKRLILLSIDVEKLLQNLNNDDIKFCPINSTDNRAKIFNISNIDELSKLHFDLFDVNRGYPKDIVEYKASQAEVLVKKCIPLYCIKFECELTQNDLWD